MIEKINLKNIRRFSELNLTIDNKNVLLIGPNAKGKTTILEAIMLASIVKSHRTNNLKEVIKTGTNFGEVKIDSTKKYRLVLTEEGKKVFINNTPYPRLSEYIGNLYTVFFSPSDLSIVTSSPIVRRNFLNQEISQIKPSYLKCLNEYNKLLLERNNYLKLDFKQQNQAIFDVLTQEVIDVGLKLIKAREAFILEINKDLNRYYQLLANDETLEIKYLPSVNSNDYAKTMFEKMKFDLLKQTTSFGPHRDDFCFILNNTDAHKYASQGQIRSIVLALKLTICKIIKEYKKEDPILLLDDVLSELDSSRQKKLLHLINDLGQTFISSTDTIGIEASVLKTYQIIELKE